MANFQNVGKEQNDRAKCTIELPKVQESDTTEIK